MAKRASLQKQSFSAPRLVAQLFRVRRSGRGLTLRRQSACFMAVESREHQHNDEDDSFFQNRLFLIKRFPLGNAANCGRTFCTARPSQCQEIRYSNLPGIMQCILSDTGKTNHQLLTNLTGFRTKYCRKHGSVVLEVRERKILSDSATVPTRLDTQIPI